MTVSDEKIILSVKDLEVKFHVRGRILTAIRGISLDIKDGESIAIVGESGSGKSVFTKTYAGMLDSNGFISRGNIIFDEPELRDTVMPYGNAEHAALKRLTDKLNQSAKQMAGAETYQEILALEKEKQEHETLSEADREVFDKKAAELKFEHTELFNLKQTYDPSKEKDKIKEATAKLKELEAAMAAVAKEKEAVIKNHASASKNDTAFQTKYNERMAALKAKYAEQTKNHVPAEMVEKNIVLAKEILLSVGRYEKKRSNKLTAQLLKALDNAMKLGMDLDDEPTRQLVFEEAVLYVKYLDETTSQLHGICTINVAKVKYPEDWTRIRGRKIATVFQDPMTSLNPIITIGKQITSVIIKHQHCSEVEARKRAIILMKKVGIPNAEKRFDDYPFEYSGGMRQRIVIAIALSCQPKILICDEPTTALDVTIQAQILRLLKKLQKELGFTIVFITHDLGVVANIAERVAVLYAGQIVEVGKVEEVFYDPRHPYTWALLSSLPQLAEKNTELFSIAGTPPSLYNKVIGDPFAPRNAYCMKIDTIQEPPMFKVTDTHYAKTWLLDPRAPKVEKPEIIDDIHGKLLKAFNI